MMESDPEVRRSLTTAGRITFGIAYAVWAAIGAATVLLGLATTWGNSPSWLPPAASLVGLVLVGMALVGLVLSAVGVDTHRLVVACAALMIGAFLLFGYVFTTG